MNEMTPNRPYLLKAFFDWILDNDLTPHLVVSALLPHVNVPEQFIKDGKIVLIDFGAVKEIQPQNLSNQENVTVAVGTRGYSPPEQYAGHPSFSSDIYAVGMIGVQAVTGIAPHQLPITQETGDVNWRNLANVSEEFGRILENMVRYHFPDRYQSIAAVMKDLESLRPQVMSN